MRTFTVLIIALVLAPAACLQAQQPGCWAHWSALGGPYHDLQRSIELTRHDDARPVAVTRAGRMLLRSCPVLDSIAAENDEGRPVLEAGVLPVAAIMQNSSEYARPQQDGLRWAGRGLSAAASGGVTARWGPVSAAVAPVIAFQQNDAFTVERIRTPGLSPWGSFYHAGRIDLPQRFGSNALWWIHPGQSFVRVDAFGAAAGFSTENLRWGPARRNPLLMSHAGPGFPHAFIGTSDALNVGIGRVELEAVWGRLAESEYFDTISTNDSRLFAGLVGAFRPRSTGLTIGVARAYLRTIPPGGLSLGDQIFGPYTGIRDNPRDPSVGDNQLLSVFFRWVLPRSGFEVYGEYAREDHWADARDFIMELDHSRAFTVGLEKVFVRADSSLSFRVAAEATNLNMSQTWQSGRGDVTFYTHSQIRQGYTHRGQLLGAPIGPGSDAQYVAADYFWDEFGAGLFVERIRYDNDTYYRHFAYPYAYFGHDAEYTFGVRGSGSVYGLQLIGEFAHSSRYNRDFVGLRDGGNSFDRNLAISLGAAWVPPAGRIFP